MPTGEFLPQPYEQLAKVYGEMGHEGDAKTILIAKNRVRTRNMRWRDGWLIKKLVRYLFSWTIAYGYRPALSLVWIFAIILAGTFIFRAAYSTCDMLPSPSYQRILNSVDNPVSVAERAAFNAFFYSLDTFVPLVDLNQESYWRPIGWRRGYLWGHILAGWVLSTLFVTGMTGVLKR